MPFEVSWYEPSRVILIRTVGDLSAEELSQSGDALRKYIEAGDIPIHLIADLSQLGKVPTSIAEIRKALGSLNKLSSSIIVGANNPVIKFMASVFAKLGGYEVRTVSSIDEAIEVITRLDPSLQHLSKAKSS